MRIARCGRLGVGCAFAQGNLRLGWGFRVARIPEHPGASGGGGVTLLIERDTLVLPDVIFLGGRKRAGKGTVAKALEAVGFTTLHIVEPWLRQWCADRGIDYDTEYLPNKGQYRQQIQDDAEIARAENPNVLLDALDVRIPEVGGKVVVDGVRFLNEAL